MARTKIRIVPIIIFIILLLTFLITPQTLIAAENITYDVSQSWFKPELIVNNNPGVCKPLLDGYMNYFKSTEVTNPLEADFDGQRKYTDSIEFIGKNLHEIKWDDYPIDDVILKVAQFKVKGNYYALVRYYYSIGWREGYYYDILISQPIGDLKLDKDNLQEYFEANNFGVLGAGKEKNIFDVIYTGDPRFEDYKSNIIGTLANIYEKNGSVYILLNADKPQPNTYMLFELIDQKQLALTCSMVTTPTNEQIGEQYDKMPAFKALKSDLLDMMGDEGNCGTAHFLGNRRSGLENDLDTMTYRPWAVKSFDDFNDKRDAVDKGLAQWGYTGIWNYYKYKSYLSNLAKAQEEIKRFYERNFLLDEKEALELGTSKLSQALTSRFVFSSQEETDHYNLETKILEGMSAAELEKESITDRAGDTGRESLLTFAIARPELLEVLLRKGFDPNAQNAFGKTPLMYAAQFNMLESAKTLLKHGAATELTTIASIDTCNYTIRTKNVSALHYAVRYSSKDLIQLLLDAGAPTYIKDSNGYTPYDYLVKFGGFAGYAQPSKKSYGELNQNLTADDRRVLRSALLPPDAEKKKELFREVNVKAEKLYNEGNLQEAYQLLKRAISLNPDNERAMSNLSLVALKLGKYGESAKLSTALIDTAKSDVEKANAYFNLGLACQKVGLKGYHYSTIEYDGHYYCVADWYGAVGSRSKDQGVLANFLEAYKLKPTKARLNAILALLQNTDMPNQKKLWFFPDEGTGIRSLYVSGRHLYFLVDSSKEVPFKNITQRYGTDDTLLKVAQKESIQLSDKLKIEKWTVEGANLFTGSLMMDDTICSPSFPNAFPTSTKLIEVYSSHKERTPRMIKWKQTVPGPVVLILYGNYIEWQLEGDLSKTVGVYVHGFSSSVKLPELSSVPTFADNHSAYEDPYGSSFNKYTRSVTGLVIDAVIDVREKDKEGCTDHPLFIFTRMPNYYIVECSYKEFDSEKFPTEMGGGGVVEVEGRKWQISYKLEKSAQLPTPLEILRHHTNPLKKIGGTVPFESSDQTAATLKLALGCEETWCNLRIRGDSYWLNIIEKEPMIHDFVDHVADIIATGIDSTGHVTIHGISSTGHAAIYGIYFDFNKSEVKPQSERALRAIGEYLSRSPNLKVFIVGHTDNVEGGGDKMKLSQARAEAVMETLATKYKVNPQNMKAYGVGPLEPVAPNRTEAGRARNRRVEFVVQQ
jgi:outer membrane protein OmpA-like peptidoglycan-associated protein